MAIVQLGSAKNITELVQRLYEFTATGPRVAMAVKALMAANPNLPADLSRLAPPTPSSWRRSTASSLRRRRQRSPRTSIFWI
jgi:hypothetical protein